MVFFKQQFINILFILRSFSACNTNDTEEKQANRDDRMITSLKQQIFVEIYDTKILVFTFYYTNTDLVILEKLKRKKLQAAKQCKYTKGGFTKALLKVRTRKDKYRRIYPKTRNPCETQP